MAHVLMQADKRVAVVCGTAAMLNSATIPEQEASDMTPSQPHPGWAGIPLLAAQ